MPDYYEARVRMWPWPEDVAPIQVAVSWLDEEFGGVVPAGDNPMIGTPNLDDDGVVTLQIEQACEGIDELDEAMLGPSGEESFLGVLREGGINFVAFDVGGDGRQGRELSWRNGLTRIRERPVLPSSQIALSDQAAQELLDEAKPDEVAAKLRNYFAPLEEYVEPTP